MTNFQPSPDVFCPECKWGYENPFKYFTPSKLILDVVWSEMAKKVFSEHLKTH